MNSPLRSSLAAVVAQFDAATLRHLVALADERERSCFVDSEETATALAEVLERGDRPAVGFYRKRLTKLAPKPRRGPSQPGAYERVVLGMLAAGFDRKTAVEAVAELALEDGVDAGVVKLLLANALMGRAA